MNPLEWLDYEFLNNSVLTWGAGLALFVGAWLVLGILRRVIRNRLAKLASRKEAAALRIAHHAVRQTKGWFLVLVAIFLGSQVWDLTATATKVLTTTVTIGVLLQMGMWAAALLASFMSERRQRRVAEDPDAIAVMDVLGFIMRLAIWTIVLLLVLDNLGINITALVAGLGVGGIAVALAVQNILGDLFASLSIALDKPFAVGDFLSIGDFHGNVEKVGIKTTRIRSLSGEQLIFSNNDLLGSRIRNYGRMFERRVLFSLGVTYQTPAEKLRRIPKIVREAIESQDNVRFDRAHFRQYGDFALLFEVVYYVLSSDYNEFMDIHQEVNLMVYERFGEEGIDFAYPTQTLFLAREAATA